jgi:hypothetical protein
MEMVGKIFCANAINRVPVVEAKWAAVSPAAYAVWKRALGMLCGSI